MVYTSEELSHLEAIRLYQEEEQARTNRINGMAKAIASKKPREKRGQNSCEIADRLERKFGLGSSPERRRMLYERLEREVETFGDCVLKTISECVQGSGYARSPERWFCKAVVARLREQGYLAAGTDQSW